MSAWRWLAHPRGRASPRMFARTAAGQFGATDAAAVALTAWHFPAGIQCESVTWAGAVSWRCRQRWKRLWVQRWRRRWRWRRQGHGRRRR
eukprot:7794831-Pyramimonas_sp.AAC.1